MPRSELLAEATAILRSLNPNLRVTSVTITGQDDAGQIIHIPIGDMGGWAFAVPAPEAERKGTRERVIKGILAALKGVGRPLKGVALARRCGRKNNSYFRGIVAGLIREGKVIHLERRGYILAPQSRTSEGESGSASTPTLYSGADSSEAA